MATLKDVAMLANVSPITVSRIINSPDSVREKTRRRVLEAMRELKYSPNLAAKSLASNRFGVVDVYFPRTMELSNQFAVNFIAGISEMLSERMNSFLVLRDLEREHACDGYIATNLFSGEVYQVVQYARERGRPLVLFGHTDIPGVDCIDVDNVRGAKVITEYLLSLGHRKLAMLNIAEDRDYPVDRLKGFTQAVEEAGLSMADMQVVYVANAFEGGVEGVQTLLRDGSPTAIFCATDLVGVGACDQLRKMGVSVPDDISVAGYDGLGRQNLVTPSLTTVRQPVFKIGEMLASALLERLGGRTEDQHIWVEPELIVGNSTAPAKSK